MPEWEKYDTLKFNGSMLTPGFSIYLLEIHYRSKPYYYIGMTGDNYYPSARSAFHRIAGHLEFYERSTQNQLFKAIKEQIKPDHLGLLEIKMHYFPIEGFTKWNGSVSSFDKKSIAYFEYKKNN